MYTTYNDEDSVKKRLYGDRLVLSGRALIILGIWSSIKAIVLFYLALPMISEFVTEGDIVPEEIVRNVKLILMAIFVVIVAIVLIYLIRLYLKRKRDIGRQMDLLEGTMVSRYTEASVT